MSQYNAQCHQIRLALKKHKFDFVNVNTVVASQGMQRGKLEGVSSKLLVIAI